MGPTSSSRPVALDHVAHAVPHWREIWGRYAHDLGARWLSGGQGRGFAPAQVAFGNEARLEMLMPWNVEVNDFLARFLGHNGPGPHHLTFKVEDIRRSLDDAGRAGFDPISVDLSQPDWMEAFFHPKQACGVVVQLAESHEDEDADQWHVPPPEGFPADRRRRRDGGPTRPAALDRVVHTVADPVAARRLFVDFLQGTEVGGGRQAGVGWTDVSWDTPLGVRLVWPDDDAGRPGGAVPPSGEVARQLADWLGDRPGRVHHLQLRVEEPASVPDARAASDALPLVGAPVEARSWEVPPASNHGLRLVLFDSAPAEPAPRGQPSTGR